MIRALLDQIFGRGRRIRQELDGIEEAVSRYSIDQARERMRPLIQDQRYYRSMQSPPSDSDRRLIATLPPSVQAFFGEFALVEEQYGDTRISRSAIGPSSFLPGFTRIGTAVDGTELVVQSNNDAVYRVDGSESTTDERDVHQSIWHYLLLMGMIIYPASFE